MSNIKRWAHIENNEVVNVSLWDGESPWNPECEIFELEENSPVGIGWTKNGKKWNPPNNEQEV